MYLHPENEIVKLVEEAGYEIKLVFDEVSYRFRGRPCSKLEWEASFVFFAYRPDLGVTPKEGLMFAKTARSIAIVLARIGGKNG